MLLTATWTPFDRASTVTEAGRIERPSQVNSATSPPPPTLVPSPPRNALKAANDPAIATIRAAAPAASRRGALVTAAGALEPFERVGRRPRPLADPLEACPELTHRGPPGAGRAWDASERTVTSFTPRIRPASSEP